MRFNFVLESINSFNNCYSLKKCVNFLIIIEFTVFIDFFCFIYETSTKFDRFLNSFLSSRRQHKIYLIHVCLSNTSSYVFYDNIHNIRFCLLRFMFWVHMIVCESFAHWDYDSNWIDFHDVIDWIENNDWNDLICEMKIEFYFQNSWTT